METPSISVIMPAYNHERFVSQAISSVLSQTLEDFELIIINDGSTDNTESEVKKYCDPRITYLFQENQGCSQTINKGIHISKGEYISIINSDDIYHKDRLKILYDSARNRNLDFLITDVELVDQYTHIVNDPDHWWIKWYESLKAGYLKSKSPVNALLAGNFTITTSNFFFKKNIIKKIGEFKLFKYIPDYDFAFRVACTYPESFMFLTEKKLLQYRLHGENTILKNPLAANHETFHFLLNAIKAVYGDDISIPAEHILQIKRHLTRELLWKNKNELSRKIEMLSHELHKSSLYSKRLIDEYCGVTASYGFKSFKAVIYPFSIVKNIILSRKPRKQIKLTVNSIHELHHKLEEIIDEIDIVSFDIFDTIFGRDIDPPDQVKAVVARYISNFLKDTYNISYSPEILLQLRNTIELKLRDAALKKGNDFECSFNEIIKEMVIHILGKYDEMLYLAMLTQETKVENEVLYVKDGIIDILNFLKKRGKKIIAASDMYLDKDHITHLLMTKSIAHLFDDIYVSSEKALCKYSGNLFKYILTKEKMLPYQMVHIGDNKISDHHIPKKLGIHTIYLRDRKDLKKKYALKTYNKLASINPYWRGRHLLQLIRPSAGNDDFFYNYGFSFLGPVYSVFTYGIIEAIKKHSIKNIFFLAREGALFHRLYNIASDHFLPKTNLPSSKYVYLTRKSTALASCYRGFPHSKAILALYNPKQQGLYSICQVFDIPADELSHIAAEYGYTDIKKPIYDWENETFKNLIKDDRLQKLVIERANTARDLLQSYLTQMGFFNDKSVAFVDIGWNLTIQKFIQDAFIEREDFPHIYGLYVGFRDGIKHNFDKTKNSIIGLLYDERNNNPVEKVICRFEEIFEESARALHPTSTGYKENKVTGMIEPIFKDNSCIDRKAELSCNAKIEKIQKGIIDFQNEFIRATLLTGYSFEDLKPFILTLTERCIALPTATEAAYVMGLNHSEDFGYENVMDFSMEVLGGMKEILNPRGFIQKIKTSNWAYGSAKSSRIPGITYLLRLYDIVWRK